MMFIERKVYPRVQSKNSYSSKSNKAATHCVLLRKWFDVLIQSDLFLLLIYYSYIKRDSFSRLLFYIAASKYVLLIWQTPLSLHWERSLLTVRCCPTMRCFPKSCVNSAALSWEQSQWPASTGALRLFHPPLCKRVDWQHFSCAGSNISPQYVQQTTSNSTWSQALF